MKLLTVAIPAYNMEHYLDRSCSSLLVKQQYLLDGLDVIIVNDGSTDRTSDIGRKYATRWPGTFRIIDKRNGNYGSCINKAIEEAKGVYFRILDADDWYETDTFEQYLRFLDGIIKKGDAPDAVLSGYRRVAQDGAELGEIAYPNFGGRVFGVDDLMPIAESVAMHGLAYRTELLRNMEYRQQEGISYTDNQFVVTPMLRVQRLISFDGMVYSYMLGRQGQTMSVVATVRSMSMYSILLSAIASDCERFLPDARAQNIAFVKKYIKHIVEFVYALFLRDVRLSQVKRCFAEFDKSVNANFPDLYKDCADLHVGRRCGYRYVSALRRMIENGVWDVLCFACLRCALRASIAIKNS